MTRDDGSRRPEATEAGAKDAAGAGVTGDGTIEAHQPRPRRALNLFDLLVRVPIGFLWLGVLAVLAVPVIVYMTLLYYAAQWISPLFGRNRKTRGARADGEEQVT